jgi:hypothetical protein
MSIEAMKQALEALEDPWKSGPDGVASAITALRAAIEHYDQTALELCNECGWRALIPGEGCLTCARQKAKPVWIQRNHLEAAQREPSMCRVEPTKRLPDFVPLYAAPRQWVGLTDEEVDEFYWISALTVEAIEAKLKEKNT